MISRDIKRYKFVVKNNLSKKKEFFSEQSGYCHIVPRDIKRHKFVVKKHWVTNLLLTLTLYVLL